MVVLAASICTRGGKAVLSRQFREMQRSRVEALLASFPKLADSGTQHTTVEQDNVRYVYQPLDELYMVLITNRQSNILQDIDSLHLFAQVVTSICRTLDEREILENAFELMSAFDEVVSLGYRENLTLTQIKTFLDMESHEERVALIIETNKQLEASEQRKMKAKQIEMQRRDQQRASRGQIPQRAPTYPSYTPPTTSVSDTTDTYAAERARMSSKSSAPLGKGMQLGKKSKATNMFDQVRGELPPEAEEPSAPLIGAVPAQAPLAPKLAAPSRPSMTGDREPIHCSLNEQISARLTRDGERQSFDVKGDLQLRISDASLTQIKLQCLYDPGAAQYNTHPKVDKSLFASAKTIQLKDTSRGFPLNQSIQVMRWRYTARPTDSDVELPLLLTAWVNESAENSYNITVEYELTGSDTLRDVVVTIPYGSAEPSVSSFDAVYEVSGDSIDWNIGAIESGNGSGSFEFEASAESDAVFFPMTVRFSKMRCFVDVDVTNVSLVNMEQGVPFSKDVKSTAGASAESQYVIA